MNFCKWLGKNAYSETFRRDLIIEKVIFFKEKKHNVFKGWEELCENHYEICDCNKKTVATA